MTSESESPVSIWNSVSMARPSELKFTLPICTRTQNTQQNKMSNRALQRASLSTRQRAAVSAAAFPARGKRHQTACATSGESRVNASQWTVLNQTSGAMLTSPCSRLEMRSSPKSSTLSKHNRPQHHPRFDKMTLSKSHLTRSTDRRRQFAKTVHEGVGRDPPTGRRLKAVLTRRWPRCRRTASAAPAANRTAAAPAQ